MELMQAFPIAIIDEDFEGKSAAGRGMRDLAAAIEKEGYRVVAGVSYADARRLVNVFNNESCWLISVDGTEAKPSQWQVLEEVLAAKRRRNDRLPIFLFGDERTAEMVPSSVLKHANAFRHFVEELTGHGHVWWVKTIPCRPFATGTYVSVPPGPFVNPRDIRPVTGHETPVPGSTIRTVYKDASDKELIYSDELEEAETYLPNEPKRYYLTPGRFGQP